MPKSKTKEEQLAYMEEYTDVKFSHGICPECVRKHYPEDGKEILKED